MALHTAGQKLIEWSLKLYMSSLLRFFITFFNFFKIHKRDCTRALLEQ